MVHDPSDSILYSFDIEVDQISKFAIRQFQIRENLSQMNVVERFHSFYLNDNLVFNEQINPIATIQSYFSVNNWKSFLLLHVQARISQLMKQTRLICRLEETGAKFAMNSECTINDYLANVILRKRHFAISSVSVALFAFSAV
jgi:hypothetical protein